MTKFFFALLGLILFSAAYVVCETAFNYNKYEQPAEIKEKSEGKANLQPTPQEKRNPTPQFEMELDKADKIMAFTNEALFKLEQNWNKTAETFYNLGHIYQKIFNLPEKIVYPVRKQSDLRPPAGLFTLEEEKYLSDALNSMDKELASMATHYQRLKNYVANFKLKDNGKEGRMHVSELEQDYKRYIKAKEKWLNIIAKNTDLAEERLLRDHPLKRQASSASKIMKILAQTSEIIQKNNSTKELQPLIETLSHEIEIAQRPPFPANPSLERLFRNFIKNVKIYKDVLARAELEGLYNIQKKEITLAASACANSYKNFINNFNKQNS